MELARRRTLKIVRKNSAGDEGEESRVLWSNTTELKIWHYSGARSAVAIVKIFGFNERTSVLSIYWSFCIPVTSYLFSYPHFHLSVSIYQSLKLFYVHIYLCICQYVCLSEYTFSSVYIFCIYQYICLSILLIYLTRYLFSTCLCMYMFPCLLSCPYVRRSLCLSRLSIPLQPVSLCPHISLYVHTPSCATPFVSVYPTPAFACLYLYLSVRLLCQPRCSLSVFLHLCPFLFVSVFLPVRPPLWLSVSLHDYLFVYLMSKYLSYSFCLSICLPTLDYITLNIWKER
jgi:hypothetical protein